MSDVAVDVVLDKLWEHHRSQWNREPMSERHEELTRQMWMKMARVEMLVTLAFLRDSLLEESEAGWALREALGLQLEKRYVEPVTPWPEATPTERRVVGWWETCEL